MKIRHEIPIDRDSTKTDPSTLNEKQKIAYNILANWMEKTKRLEKDDMPEQLLFQICGKAGCGKSYFLSKFS